MGEEEEVHDLCTHCIHTDEELRNYTKDNNVPVIYVKRSMLERAGLLHLLKNEDDLPLDKDSNSL